MSKPIITDDGQRGRIVNRDEYVSKEKYSKEEIRELDSLTNDGAFKSEGKARTPLQQHQQNVYDVFNYTNALLPENYNLLPLKLGQSFWVQDHVNKLESLYVRHEVNDMRTKESLFASVAKGFELQSKALQSPKKRKIKRRKWIKTQDGPAVEFTDGGACDIGVRNYYDSVPALIMNFEHIFSRISVLGAGKGNLLRGHEVLDYIHEQFRKEGEQYLELMDWKYYV